MDCGHSTACQRGLTNRLHRAKYVEGLENRLSRMESLLRLSGLLGDDDGATDLGTLEKRLAEKVQQKRGSLSPSDPTSPSLATPGKDGILSPESSLTSPEPSRDETKHSSVTPEDPEGEEEEVEALSEMMCSLVTNHSGETRYIGKTRLAAIPPELTQTETNHPLPSYHQARHLASPSSRPRAFNGSTRRLGTHHSKR